MSKVQIYTTNWCPYCNAAKSLLDDKGIPYEEIDAADPAIRDAMIQRANGRRTVPQIFIGETHVGAGSVIGPNSVLRNARIGRGCVAQQLRTGRINGPRFASLRRYGARQARPPSPDARGCAAGRD